MNTSRRTDSKESFSLRGVSHGGSGDGRVPRFQTQPEKGPNPTGKHLKSCHYLLPSFCHPPSNLDSKWLLSKIFSQLSVLHLKYQMLFSDPNFPCLLHFPHSQTPQSCFTEVFGLSGKIYPSWPEPPVAPASVTLAICGDFAF